MDLSPHHPNSNDIPEKICSEDLDFNARPSHKCPSPGAIAHLEGEPSDSTPLQLNNVDNFELDRPTAARKVLEYLKSQTTSTPFEVAPDTYLLYYGSLMDPEVLQAVLNLPTVPVMQEGWVEGYMVKKWGIYPTVVPQSGSKVYGKAWRIEMQIHMDRLVQYETEAYTPEICEIKLVDGRRISDVRIFKWSGTLESKNIYDGEFDLGWYQKFIKPGLIRSWKAQEREKEEMFQHF